MTNPIRPDEVKAAKTIPHQVIETFNALITENFHHGCATVLQKEVVSRLVDAGLDKKEIFKRGWLDVEALFEDHGWKVNHDNPGYNETYDAVFEFRPA